MINHARKAVVGAVASGALTLGVLGVQPALASEETDSPPPDLVQAVETDLGMTWQEFVRAGAQVEGAAATIEAAPTGQVARLTADGVDLTSAQTLGDEGQGVSPFVDLDAVREAYLREVGPEGLTGVAITLEGYEVLVADPEEAGERGRTAPEGELVSPAEWGRRNGVIVSGTSGDPQPAATVRGGTPIAFNGVGCSHGFNGWYQGKTRGIAVGHCVTMGGTNVTWGNGSYLGTVDWYQFGAPGSGWETYGTDLSTYTIASGISAPPEISTANGALTITGRAAAVLGMPVCKQGRMTGWTCSTVTKIGWQWIGDGSGDITRPKRWVWSLFADTRIIPGDSGGPWVSGRKAVGVTSSYDWHDDGSPYSTAALLTSLDEYRPGAQVRVWLGRSVLSLATYTDSYTARARWSAGSTVSGRMTTFSGDSVSAGTVVDVRVDGTLVASPKVVADGAFSFTYPGSDSSTHTVTFQARSGDSRGSTVTVTDQPSGTVPKLVRHSGSDRYSVAADIALSTWSGRDVGTVYLASGQTFPDALSGSALAGSEGVPVLPTRKGSLPSASRDALVRLAPERVVVLGGTATVASTVVDEVRALGPSVSRIAGADRYEVSANIAAMYPSASTVFVSAGSAFADGLAASARAGVLDAPLLLSKTAVLPDAAVAQLERLRPSKIVIVGGPVSVNPSVETQLRQYAAEVIRVGGDNRYEVAANVARLYWVPANQVWLAKGTDYPDALAAAPAAALNRSPVVLTKPSVLPAVTTSAIKRLKPPVIHLAGGPDSITSAVAEELRWLTFR
ncbi:cell wall-binding repeat-containing protein [Ornithinimicrobium panacihumi]|uniref:cell wall-binding repeat-containing protein n=1 Tax=Ornithinimicrobium panacihumi TaxID=2008449 RepID=UPI003F88D752